MGNLADIVVSPGKARSHRVNAALDRLREQPTPPPTRLRVLVEVNLPRGQRRPPRLEYQRVASTMIDCRTPEAARYVRRMLAHLMRRLHGMSLRPDAFFAQEYPEERE